MADGAEEVVPRRKWGLAFAAAFLVVASVGGFFAYRHWRAPDPAPRKQIGETCLASDECPETPCIREFTGESYCAKLCDTDDECSAAYVCDPTRSLLRHVCMKAGVQTGVASGGSPVYRRVREP